MFEDESLTVFFDAFLLRLGFVEFPVVFEVRCVVAFVGVGIRIRREGVVLLRDLRFLPGLRSHLRRELERRLSAGRCVVQARSLELLE